MSTSYIINYLNRRGLKVSYCNDSVFVWNRFGYSNYKKFRSYNAAYLYYKSIN